METGIDDVLCVAADALRFPADWRFRIRTGCRQRVRGAARQRLSRESQLLVEPVSTTRRGFLGSAAANAAALAVFPGSLLADMPVTPATGSSAEWDLTWTEKVTGKHKAVFDIVETENGIGVLRAAFWGNQYIDVMKAAPADLSPILVLRHNAII